MTPTPDQLAAHKRMHKKQAVPIRWKTERMIRYCMEAMV